MHAYKTRRPLVGFAISYALGLQIGYECNPPLIYSVVGCAISLYITWRSSQYGSKTGYYLLFLPSRYCTSHGLRVMFRLDQAVLMKYVLLKSSRFVLEARSL